MASSDPREAIIERLFPASGKGRGGLGARVETVQFLKTRQAGHRMVKAISFETVSGRHTHMVCYLLQNEQGQWKFSGAAGNEGEQGRTIRNSPSADIGGGGWPDYFFAGGTIIEQGHSIARVCLIAGNGVVMEDEPEAGVVLFVTEEKVTLPIHARLYDSHGTLVGSHPVLSI